MEKNICHKLNIEERATLEITGVKDVETYNEEEIEILTSYGTLTVCGSGFNISKLDIETGEMKINGKIDSLFYSDHTEKNVSILRRLFK